MVFLGGLWERGDLGDEVIALKGGEGNGICVCELIWNSLFISRVDFDIYTCLRVWKAGV